MTQKKLLLIFVITFYRLAVQAQTTYSYYFDKDLNLVAKPARAVFLGVGAYLNGLFELKVYEKRNNNLLVMEHFTDSTLARSNGLFVSFLSNGNKEWEGIYNMGKKDGLWKRWNGTGQVVDSALYANGNKISEAKFGFYPSGKLMSEEIFSGDSITMDKIFAENGKEIPINSKEDTDKVFTKVEVEASYPGGLQAWAKYISRAIQRHIDDFTKRDYGTCLIRFIVNTKGEVSEVQATTMQGTTLAEVAVNAIRSGPRWVPAQQKGHAVNAYRLQPVTLQNPKE